MPDLKKGSNAPSFTLATDAGKTVTLQDYAGKTLVLYFYPKDDTPGCTAQACGFRDNLPEFFKIRAAVLGVSRDPIKSHEKFRDKYDLNFPLAADKDGKVCDQYGVWVEKSMYGRKYMGIERSTFMIGPDGKIQKIWRKVKVPGHVEEVLKETGSGK